MRQSLLADPSRAVVSFFFFNDTATTEIYTLSLHDALPISLGGGVGRGAQPPAEQLALRRAQGVPEQHRDRHGPRSEEHTSELQSQSNLVCRLLLDKKINDPPTNAPFSPSRPPPPSHLSRSP